MIAAIARRLAALIGPSAGKVWSSVALRAVLGLSDKAWLVGLGMAQHRARPKDSAARQWQGCME
jgi:hypothetical protein